jgi:hypothetical protein
MSVTETKFIRATYVATVGLVNCVLPKRHEPPGDPNCNGKQSRKGAVKGLIKKAIYNNTISESIVTMLSFRRIQDRNLGTALDNKINHTQQPTVVCFFIIIFCQEDGVCVKVEQRKPPSSRSGSAWPRLPPRRDF